MWTFPDRSKLLLSGEEIINLKQSSLKDIPAGSKDYAPDNSWLEQKQIQATLETHHCLVSAQRIEKKSHLSSAVWLPNVGKAKVTKKAGKHWEVFGHTVNSEDWLLPEEALFLLETNALVLQLDEVPLSIEQSYSLIIGDFISLAEYRVYSHLSRKGYRVLRHDKEISVTPYEKDIRADQVSLATKRSRPGSKEDRRGNVVPSKDGEGAERRWVDIFKSSQSERKGSDDLEGVTAAVDQPANDTRVSSEDDVALSHSNDEQPTAESQQPILTTNSQQPSSTQRDPASPQKNLTDPQSSAETSTSSNGSETNYKEPDTTELPKESEPSDSRNSLKIPPSDARHLVAKGNILISEVQELISLGSEGSAGDDAASDLNVVVEMPEENAEEASSTGGNPEESMNVDDSSSDDEFPRPIPSPDLMIVESKDQVIEIVESSDEGEDPDVVIMDVRKPNENVDTVELLDSEEDDDVVVVYQKPANTDPSKWRKWFLSTTEFVNYKFKEHPEASTKIPKTKLIDLFDLAQKSMDSIWKAIPRHDGNEEFINSPDQRFLPTTILPKFAQYRINLNQRDVSPYSERCTPGNVDTSHNLDEIVQYGQEPSYFSRNEGYSFHRSRNYNRNAPWFNPNALRPPRNQMFDENHRNYRNDFQGTNLQSFGQANDANQNQQQISNVNQNQYFNRNRYGNQNRNFGHFGNQAQRPMNFRPQGNFGPQFGNLNQFGGNQNEGLRMAVMQAYQLQMLAVGLMQSCQSIFQQVPGLMNPMNTFPMNNLLGTNLVGNFNQPPQQFQHNRRPYRRPWRGQGRRRYYNDDRPEVPRVMEIPITPDEKKEEPNVVVLSDEEDKKVKPALKRSMALNAIARLNKPKRRKVKISTEVRSIKLDAPTPSWSIVIDADEVSSVKSESPCSSPKLSGSPKRPKKLVTDESPLTKDSTSSATPVKTSHVVDTVKPQETVRIPDDNTDSQPAIEVSDDSRPSYFVYDEQVSIDSDSVGFVANASQEPAPRKSPDQSEPMEETSLDDAPRTQEIADLRPATSETMEDLVDSWKTYKEQELPVAEAQPSHSRALISIGNERLDIKDVMKSLRVIGPIDDTEVPREELQVSYDVYLPNQPFRKSVRLVPNYRVIVPKSDCFPTVSELNHLEATYRDNVPFLYAVVTLDAIRLYNLRSVSLPSLVPDV